MMVAGSANRSHPAAVDTLTDLAPRIPVRTLRFKVRTEAYGWLSAAAIEVNQVFNYCNETSRKAAMPYYGKPRWLSGFDLCGLTAGASECFEHIGADTIQRVCIEYAQKRRAAKKLKLRWRVSFGSRRALGWVPFKAANLRRHGKYLRFCGKTFRFFEAARWAVVKQWRGGCFAQDAVGDWYLCVFVKLIDDTPPPDRTEVGLDLGLKDTVVTSDGERLAAGVHYRSLEGKIAQAQRRGHRRQAKRLHRRAGRCRRDALHKFTRHLVNHYQSIVIGDVSSQALVRTRMAKAVLDCSWGELKRQLLYKGEHAGRCVRIVSERNTTRTCSSCRSLTGPQGVNGLRVRAWICTGCGATQDRDVNAARNILLAGRSPRPWVGNERSSRQAPPSRASRSRKARIAPATAAS